MRLQQTLAGRWTQCAMSAGAPIHLNKFVPSNWITGGVLPDARLRLLQSAGWETFEFEDKRYLMPDVELASFALGTAYEDYRAMVEGRGGSAPAPSPYAGAYGDLIDAILYNGCLDGQTTFESGATLLYPQSFKNISPDAGILRRMGLALRGGWAMVSPITEGRDLFLIPPEAIIKGKEVTPEDKQISRGVLQRLYELGLTGLRGRGFGNARIAPAVFAMPDRYARGQSWASLVTDQTARWGGADITPVVDFKKFQWIEDFPELGQFFERHHPYVERFDLMRIEFYLSAWRQTANIDALEHMIGGVKGVMGEIAARQEIVEEYRGNLGGNRILLFAPQIMSGGDVLERSDAAIVRIEDDGTHAVIEQLWEVVTSDDARDMVRAREQHDASALAYQKGGIIFRDVDGRSLTCKKAVLPEVNIEKYSTVICGRDSEMDQVLDAIRDRMVVMMEMDLIGTRVRSRFSPTMEELQKILREPQGVERLAELLGAVTPNGRIYVTGQVRNDGQVTGLRIVDEEEAGRLWSQYFLLGFDPENGGYVLRKAKGPGALDFAVPWVESRLGRRLDTVERSFFAGILGTRMRSGDPEGRIRVESMAWHIREHGIERFLALMQVVGAATPKGRIYVTGQVRNDGQVTGLRIVDEKEAGSLGKDNFLLGFDPENGGYALCKAKGPGALDLAAPWIESRLGRKVDVVERSFLAGILGTMMQSGDPEGRIRVESLAGYIREHGIERFLALMRVVGKPIPNGRIYVTGQVQSGGQVVGLRIVDEKEVGKLVGTYFRVGFDPVDGGYALRKAKGRGALDFAAPWVESRLGRKVDVVERSFLAGILGTMMQSGDPEESLVGHIREHGIERFLALMRVVGEPIPNGRIYVTGHAQSDGQVVGLRIVDEEEAGRLWSQYFLLGFDPENGGYALRKAKGWGALDFAVPWVESRLGRRLDTVERSFFAGILGTMMRSGDPEGRIRVESMAWHIREHGIERFLALMRVVGKPIPNGRIYVTGHAQSDGQVVGLRIVDEKEVGKLVGTYFRVGFDPVDGGYALRKAKGPGALDFAAPWIESRLGRKVDVVERSFLAGILGTMMRSGDPEGRIRVESLAGYIREHGIERFLALMQVMGAATPKGRIYVTGQVRNDGQVTGLRIVDEKEAKKLEEHYFRLGFDPEDGGYALRKAKGPGALDFAVPWVESRLGRRLDTVERSFFAGILGTKMLSSDPEGRIRVEPLAGHIREHGIERFLALMQVVGAATPKGRIYVTGQVQSGGQVVGLRIVDEKEAGNLQRHYFLLGFDFKDGAYQLDRTKMRASPSLKKALLP